MAGARRSKPKVVFTLGRHTKADTIAATGGRPALLKGALDAFKRGKALSKKFPKHTIVSSSTQLDRGIVAADSVARAFGRRAPRVDRALPAKEGATEFRSSKKRMGIAISPKLGLDTNFFIDKKAATKALTELGEPVAMRKWLDGDTFSNSVKPAKEVAESIITSRARVALRAMTGKAGKKFENIIFDNVSHGWITEAVFERLTGQKYSITRPNKLLRENERMFLEMHTSAKGEPTVVLKYRNYRKDVTKQFMEIISGHETGLRNARIEGERRRTANGPPYL